MLGGDWLFSAVVTYLGKVKTLETDGYVFVRADSVDRWISIFSGDSEGKSTNTRIPDVDAG